MSQWLRINEVAKRAGVSDVTVGVYARKGKVKAKRANEGKGGKEVWLVHESEIPKFEGIARGPKTRAFHNGVNPPDLGEERIEDYDISFVDGFQVDKGRHGFAQWILAVKLGHERADWRDIQAKTGIGKLALCRFITELKEARREEPNKFKTVMDYLNAGRPYQASRRDVLKSKRG